MGKRNRGGIEGRPMIQVACMIFNHTFILPSGIYSNSTFALLSSYSKSLMFFASSGCTRAALYRACSCASLILQGSLMPGSVGTQVIHAQPATRGGRPIDQRMGHMHLSTLGHVRQHGPGAAALQTSRCAPIVCSFRLALSC